MNIKPAAYEALVKIVNDIAKRDPVRESEIISSEWYCEFCDSIVDQPDPDSYDESPEGTKAWSAAKRQQRESFKHWDNCTWVIACNYTKGVFS